MHLLDPLKSYAFSVYVKANTSLFTFSVFTVTTLDEEQ